MAGSRTRVLGRRRDSRRPGGPGPAEPAHHVTHRARYQFGPGERHTRKGLPREHRGDLHCRRASCRSDGGTRAGPDRIRVVGRGRSSPDREHHPGTCGRRCALRERRHHPRPRSSGEGDPFPTTRTERSRRHRRPRDRPAGAAERHHADPRQRPTPRGSPRGRARARATRRGARPLLGPGHPLPRRGGHHRGHARRRLPARALGHHGALRTQRHRTHRSRPGD